VEQRTDTLATGSFALAGPKGDFLKLQETRRLFRLEQMLPSAVIDRGSLRAWEEAGSPDAFARARVRVTELVARYTRPELPPDLERGLYDIARREARRWGLERLPGTPPETR